MPVDKYDPTSKGERPSRQAYSSEPGNLNKGERPKVAGNSKGNLTQHSGTDNLRAEQKTKSARIPEAGSGRKKTPAAVDSYRESNDETV